MIDHPLVSCFRYSSRRTRKGSVGGSVPHRPLAFLAGAAGAVAVLGFAWPAAAQTGDVRDLQREVERLRAAVAVQQDMIEQQRRLLEEQARRSIEQDRRIDTQRLRLDALDPGRIGTTSLPGIRATGPVGALAEPPPMPQVGQAPPVPPAAAPGSPAPVPAEEVEDAEPERPSVQAIASQGGVLTPRGHLIIEPQFEFTNTSRNVFLFQGIEIVDAILIGLIEASDSSRDALTGSVTGRLGITDRFEIDASIPYVYRNDRISRTFNIAGADVTETETLTGSGLGDIDFGAHYQINDGTGGWPFLIANVRVKPPTGEGPFDVDRNAAGVATELATGSGFLAVEPSLTAIFPSSPLVFFGNVGYIWNMADDIDETFGEGTRIGRVDPGDSITASFGVGFAVNPRTSLSFGYQHQYVLGTSTEINGLTTESDNFHLGSILFGANYRISDATSVSVNVEAGVTEEAPDVRISVRVPFDLGEIF